MIHWRQLIAGTALAVGTTVLTLGAVEVGLRVQEALQPKTPPPAARGNFWRRHPEIGWVHPPSYAALWFDDRGEFSVSVTTNSKGLNDVEHDYAKTPGTYRILVIGDSYIEALQVPLDETFSRLLETQLSAARRVEVIS